MKNLHTFFIRGLSMVLLILLFSLSGIANTANISCGNPSKTGVITVVVLLEDANGNKQTVSWNVAINKNDDGNTKAEKIRNAAPPADPKVSVAGNGNVVSATSANGWTIKKMGFKNDTTNEVEAYNVFTIALENSGAYIGFDGMPSGIDDDGFPGFVGIEVNGGFSFVDLFPMMDLNLLLLDMQSILQNQGIPSQIIDPGNPIYPLIMEPGSNFPILFLDQLTQPVFTVYTFDTGMAMAEGGLIDLSLLNPTSNGLLFNGLQHSELGQSTLSESNGTLTVSNIGSSGQDGVHIDLGDSDGFRSQFSPLDPSFNHLTIESFGTLSGSTGQSLGTVQVQPNGGDFQFLFDYSSIGNTSMRIEIWDNGQIVDAFPGIPGPNFGFDAPVQPSGCGKLIPDNQLLCYVVDFPSNQTLNLPGIGSVQGDEVRVLAENGNGTVEFINEALILVDFPTSGFLDLLSLELGYTNHFFHGTGGLDFETTGGNLVVSNIGSSGLDGVQIDLGTSTSGTLGFQDIQTGNGSVQFEFNGLNNELFHSFGQFTFSDDGSNKLFGFKVINPEARISIELYEAGVLLDYLVLPAQEIEFPVLELPDQVDFDLSKANTTVYGIPIDPVGVPFPGLSDQPADELRIVVEEDLVDPVVVEVFLDIINSTSPAGITFKPAQFKGLSTTKSLQLFDCLSGCIITYDGNLDEMKLCIQDCFKEHTCPDKPQLRFFEPGSDFNESPHAGEVLVVPPGTANLGLEFGYFDPLTQSFVLPELPYLDGFLEVLPFDQLPPLPIDPFLAPWLPDPGIIAPIPTFPGIIDPSLAGTSDGLLIQGTAFDSRGEAFTCYGVMLIDDGSLINPPPPVLTIDPLVIREFNPFIGHHFIIENDQFHFFNGFGLPIALNIGTTGLGGIVPDPRNNGGFWVADSTKVKCYNQKGEQVNDSIPTAGKGCIIPDPRNNGGFWVADTVKVRCYNQDGEQVGTDISTTGKADITADPRNNGGFWIVDSVSVRCYNQNGQQVGNPIPVAGKGCITPDPRNNGGFWVADTVRVRCYNQNGQQVGNDIKTKGKGGIVSDPRNNGSFWVADTSRVRCYDQNGRLRTTATTNGKSTVVPDPRGNGNFWLEEDDRVTCYNRRGRRVGRISTTGRPCITPDPRNNGGFWVADDNSVRCFDSRGRQVGNTINTNTKAKIVSDPRNNGGFWISENNAVRCFNQNGQQIGNFPTNGKASITPDPRNNGGFWVADDNSVKCYDQDGQQVGSTVNTAGKGEIIPDPRRNGGFWVADDDEVRCYDQNGNLLASLSTPNGSHLALLAEDYDLPLPSTVDSFFDVAYTIGDRTFNQDPDAYFPLGETIVTYTATNESGASSTAQQTVRIIDRLPFSPQIMLEGPFDPLSGLMQADLFNQGLLPLQIQMPVEAFLPGNPIVGQLQGDPLNISNPLPEQMPIDWLGISLWDEFDPTIFLGGGIGILLPDGTLVNPDGSPFNMTGALGFQLPDRARIGFHTRNHLDGISTQVFDLTDNPVITFFGETSILNLDADGMTLLSNGNFALRSGDTNGDRVIDSADRSNAWNARTQSGYLGEDVNLDGIVDSEDRSIIWNNRLSDTDNP